MGSTVEWIGFLNRSITSYQGDTPSKAADNINLVFILVAPVWFAASIYILFGRLILLLDGNDLAIIKQKWLTAIFVCGDVASLIIQAAGKLSIQTSMWAVGHHRLVKERADNKLNRRLASYWEQHEPKHPQYRQNRH
jgi:hypothetical protein